MTLVLGLLACLGLWWLSKNGGGLRAVLAALPLPRLAAWAALAAAGFLLLRGNLVLAAGLGLGGLWMLEGPAGIGRRVCRYMPGASPGDGKARRRTRTIEAVILSDGTLTDFRAVAGPEAGTRIDALPLARVLGLLALCRRSDPEGAALLQAYLDRRSPGWRVDAEGDADPRARGAPQPGAMTEQQAYEILGLQRGATAEQVRAAHRGLMKSAHPDQGGSAERAARINAARDRLLDRHR